MDRAELEAYITKTYGAQAESPWTRSPQHKVFRHRNNQKWFALLMDVPKVKLGLQEEGVLDIVNFKCDPITIGSLRAGPGFFPAYHMNKENWITVALDGSVPDDKVKMLLDISFEATAGRVKKCRMSTNP
ncbi:MAG: MmcQ/YjbR family DNA-binding protein [Clostridiales bacterium]|nr:MmcQ/YjbR family DNA-binding protein [Clostridiales bacterium]